MATILLVGLGVSPLFFKTNRATIITQHHNIATASVGDHFIVGGSFFGKLETRGRNVPRVVVVGASHVFQARGSSEIFGIVGSDVATTKELLAS